MSYRYTSKHIFGLDLIMSSESSLFPNVCAAVSFDEKLIKTASVHCMTANLN